MNATYQKSQTTTRVRPIYTVSKGQSRLYVLPAYRKGAVTVRIEHTEGENVKKLCCAIRTNIVLSMAGSVPKKNATAVDIISPEKCAEKGYRDDGLGYVRTLLVTPSGEGKVMCSITCTLGERDEEGHICSCGDYSHIEQIELTEQEIAALAAAVKEVVLAAEQEENEKAAQPKPAPQRRNYKRQVVNKA